jgi:hypothetical protein
MTRLKDHLNYANLVSTLALFMALGGAGAFAAGQLAPRSVGERQLRPGAVTPDKLRKNAVTAPKIAALAVKEGKLAGGAVSATKLADGAVASAKLGAGAVVTEKLAAEAVTGEKVNEGTLGQVPSAVTAGSAAFADAANPAAFARVDKAGVLDQSSSKGIASASQLEAGVYCVTVGGFSPRGVQVTPIFEGIGSTDAFARIGGAAACPSPQVEVQLWNGGVKVEGPFYLTAYR